MYVSRRPYFSKWFERHYICLDLSNHTKSFNIKTIDDNVLMFMRSHERDDGLSIRLQSIWVTLYKFLHIYNDCWMSMVCAVVRSHRLTPQFAWYHRQTEGDIFKGTVHRRRDGDWMKGRLIRLCSTPTDTIIDSLNPRVSRREGFLVGI